MTDQRPLLPVTRQDCEALCEDIWQSIPRYMHRSIEQAFARHRLLGEQRAIARIVNVSRTVAEQAGVGGRETAGAIVSYLATSPGEIRLFVAGELSPLDFAGDWMRGGCLSWHSVRGDIVHPEDLANILNSTKETGL